MLNGTLMVRIEHWKFFTRNHIPWERLSGPFLNAGSTPLARVKLELARRISDGPVTIIEAITQSVPCHRSRQGNLEAIFGCFCTWALCPLCCVANVCGDACELWDREAGESCDCWSFCNNPQSGLAASWEENVALKLDGVAPDAKLFIKVQIVPGESNSNSVKDTNIHEPVEPIELSLFDVFKTQMQVHSEIAMKINEEMQSPKNTSSKSRDRAPAAVAMNPVATAELARGIETIPLSIPASLVTKTGARGGVLRLQFTFLRGGSETMGTPAPLIAPKPIHIDLDNQSTPVPPLPPGYKFHAFITYRRLDGRNHLAGLLKEVLEARGFSVFFDLETLRAGVFDSTILESLRASCCDVFVLVPGTLDRCIGDADTKDWVHKEIAEACHLEKAIIPVVDDPQQRFPATDGLPTDMQNFPRHNAMFWVNSMQKACINELADRICLAVTNARPFSELKPSLFQR